MSPELTPARATALYTLARFAIFGGLLVLFSLVTGWLWAVIAAAVLSSVASYFLLARYRVAMSSGIEGRLAQRRARSEAKAAREDEAAEVMIRAERAARDAAE